MSGAQTAHAAMSDARIAQAEERAKAILAEMTHTRTRCDDCGTVNPRLDDRGLHDGCPAGDWPRPPMRDWTKLEGVAGLCEIANLMIDLVGDVRRSRELAASYDMDHALRDAAEQAELLQHGAERARDEARAEAHRLRDRLIAAERERSEDAESTRTAWRESERREQELRDRLIAAERERDALAATLETRTAEHAMARATELEAIIAGRTTPPTDEELATHERATGLWRVRWAYLNGGLDHVETDTARRLRDDINSKLRWWSLDADGCPCAWPTAVEQAR